MADDDLMAVDDQLDDRLGDHTDGLDELVEVGAQGVSTQRYENSRHVGVLLEGLVLGAALAGGRRPRGRRPPRPGSGLGALAVDRGHDRVERGAAHQVVLPLQLVRRVRLGLLAGAEADARDAVAAGRGDEVGREGPLVDCLLYTSRCV